MDVVQLESVHKLKGYDELINANLVRIDELIKQVKQQVEFMEKSFQPLFDNVEEQYSYVQMIYADVRQCVDLLARACNPNEWVEKSADAISIGGLKRSYEILREIVLGEDLLLFQKSQQYFAYLQRFLGKCYPSVVSTGLLLEDVRERVEDIEKLSLELNEYLIQLQRVFVHREVALVFLKRGDVWLHDDTELLKRLHLLSVSLQNREIN